MRLSRVVFETMTGTTMQIFHPIFGELVTANRLVRGGRWVFRGTIVPLDDVFADLDGGMSLHEVWEKHGALVKADLEAVAVRASRGGAMTMGEPVGERRRAA
ncbi:DUF433 domain-containing protein [Aureimonas sp. ME7]|uniref:DUF433 domain-containing protein n=1 Tax=Aureimonas sp. ME7 TaxID=2744252 RepID=UPI0015F4EC33|nr:DUF433 domain-containing protein [Aureimonas sp. ME7]